jgi:hypothetical protein
MKRSAFPKPAFRSRVPAEYTATQTPTAAAATPVSPGSLPPIELHAIFLPPNSNTLSKPR